MTTAQLDLTLQWRRELAGSPHPSAPLPALTRLFAGPPPLPPPQGKSLTPWATETRPGCCSARTPVRRLPFPWAAVLQTQVGTAPTLHTGHPVQGHSWSTVHTAPWHYAHLHAPTPRVGQKGQEAPSSRRDLTTKPRPGPGRTERKARGAWQSHAGE